MKTTKVLLIGGGVAVAGLVAYVLYKSKTAAANPVQTTTTAQLPSAAQAAPNLLKQTLFKDPDGNIFEITTRTNKFGNIIKVNGSDNTGMEVFVQGPDGYMVGVTSEGSLHQYKNGWITLSKYDKAAASAYLAKIGVAYPLSGLKGLPYILN